VAVVVVHPNGDRGWSREIVGREGGQVGEAEEGRADVDLRW